MNKPTPQTNPSTIELDALICVPEQETLSAALEAMGWRHAWSKPVPAPYGQYYGASLAQEHRYVSSRDNSGGIHLLTTPQPKSPIRDKISTYELGGWFDLDIRTADNDFVHQRLTDGFDFTSNVPPQQWQFGPFTVIEWLSINSFGLVVATMQRINPPLPSPPPRGYGEFFNSSFLVGDVTPVVSFYQDVLGCSVTLHEKITLADHPLRHVLNVERSHDATLELVLLAGTDNRYFVEPIAIHHSEQPAPAYTDITDTAPPHLGLYAMRIYEKDLPGIEQRAAAHPYAASVTNLGDMLIIKTADNCYLEIQDSSRVSSTSS